MFSVAAQAYTVSTPEASEQTITRRAEIKKSFNGKGNEWLEKTDALNQKGNDAWALSNYEQAVQSYKQAIAATEAVQKDAPKNARLFAAKSFYQGNLAKINLTLSRYDQAYAIANEALASAGRSLELSPGEPHGLTAKGRSLRVLGNYQKTISHFDLAQERYDEAIKVFEQGIAADPSRTSNIIGKANALAEKGNIAQTQSHPDAASDDLKQAFYVVRQAIEQEPRNQDYVVELAKVKCDIAELQSQYFSKPLALENIASALKDLEGVLKECPQNCYAKLAKTSALLLRGDVEMSQGEPCCAKKSYQLAKKELTSVLEIAPHDHLGLFYQVELFMNNGDRLVKQRKPHLALASYKQALAACDESISLFPDDIYFYNLKGLLLRRIARRQYRLAHKQWALDAQDKAIEAFAHATRSAPDSLNIYEMSAKTALERGKQSIDRAAVEAYEKAAISYTEIVRLEPKEIYRQRELASILYREGFWLLKMGDPNQAIIVLQKAIDTADLAIKANPEAPKYSTRSLNETKGVALERLGLAQIKMSMYDLAKGSLQSSVDSYKAYIGLDSWDKDAYLKEGIAFWALAISQVATGQPDAAQISLDEASKAFSLAMAKQTAKVRARFGSGNLIVDKKTMTAKLSQGNRHAPIDFETAQRAIDHRAKMRDFWP